MKNCVKLLIIIVANRENNKAIVIHENKFCIFLIIYMVSRIKTENFILIVKHDGKGVMIFSYNTWNHLMYLNNKVIHIFKDFMKIVVRSLRIFQHNALKHNIQHLTSKCIRSQHL